MPTDISFIYIYIWPFHLCFVVGIRDILEVVFIFVSRPPEAQFQGLANQTAGFNVLNPNEVAQQIQIVVSMPQEVHFEVFPSESAGPSLPSNQIQIFVSGLQELQPQGFPTQTAPPIAHNPIQGIYQQSQFMQTEQVKIST